MSDNSWMKSKCGNSACDNNHRRPDVKKDDCCCKNDMKKALQLLFDPTLALDFANTIKFGFIGEDYTVGVQLTSKAAATNKDNLSAAATAVLQSFNPCNCDYINIAPTLLYYPVVTATDLTPVEPLTGMTINRISLCNVTAIATEFLTATQVTDFSKLLDPKTVDCNDCHCKDDCDDCCCNDSILREISSFYPTSTSLYAGWLALNGVKVLGTVGNVLVLTANFGTNYVLYFVCADSISAFTS